MKKSLIALVAAASLVYGGEQFAMSDADRAMYQELLEANPAEIMMEDGAEKFEELCNGEEGLAKFLGVGEDELYSQIAGFPRFVDKLDRVVGLDQVMQAMMVQNGHKAIPLKSDDMFAMLAYVKSLANGEKINIDVHANKQMLRAYALGEEVFTTKRGGRGLSCMSCHSPDVIGGILRTQPLPDLGKNNAGGTWPAYRMTKSSLRTLQRRFQGCMNNALLAVIPIGSEEMVALEVYVTEKAKGNEIAIPGLKR
jgi:sulfur-oxidizing protein SoxA